MRMKYARKLSFFVVWLLYEQLLGKQNGRGLVEPLSSIRLNC